MIPRGPGISKRSYLRAVGRDFLQAVSQIAFVITMLAHQAWLMSDAIVRTLVRVYVTRRHLLEWVTAAQAKSGLGLDLWGSIAEWPGACPRPVRDGDHRLASARSPGRGGPFLLLWMVSPAVARWVSSPGLAAATAPLSAADARALRLIARRTWRFFTTFVGPEDHWLPPDNFQEDPRPVVAHRTSPTNLGLYLLSIVAARDFGWIGTLDAVDRLGPRSGRCSASSASEATSSTGTTPRTSVPSIRGTCRRSTAGNLAGHLIALGHACRDIIERPLRSGGSRGIEDAALLVRESARASAEAGARARSPGSGWRGARRRLGGGQGTGRGDGVAATACRLKAHARAVTDLARGMVEDDRRTSPSQDAFGKR